MATKTRKRYLSHFPEHWKVYRMDEILERLKNKVEVKKEENYKQIGIRSHGKGLFHKEAVTGEELGNKSVFYVEPNCFVVNIVFAWEMAVAKTTTADVGLIASHRFPIYKPNPDLLDLDFLLYYFKMPLGKYLLELASPGGAGRNKTLGQKEFAELEICMPPLDEQRRIAETLIPWDKSIEISTRLIEQLKLRKKALMQQVFSCRIRCEGFSGDWKNLKGDEVFFNSTNKNHDGTAEVLSATQENGIIPRSETGIDIKYDKSSLINYKKVEIGEFVISLRSFQGGIEYSNYEGLVSPAYTVLKERIPISKDFYKEYLKTTDFIKRLNTIIYGIRDGKQISYKDFSTLKLPYPPLEEQIAIANILSIANNEIKAQESHLESLQRQRKGLMQQLLTGKTRVTN